MTDREMLELAAKAAGVTWVIMNGWCGDIVKRRNFESGCGVFDPRTDDGDALRLAVKLGIYVKVFPAEDIDGQHYSSFAEAWRAEDDDPLWVEYEVTDPAAATRRAIVRAAAEIGRSMK